MGQLVALEKRGEGALATIQYEPWPNDPLLTGESVAVQGTCLTVANGSQSGLFQCDVLAETLATTNLGTKQPGALLNLERAMRQGDRLGGHITSGHVDGVGSVDSISKREDDHVLRIGCDEALASGIILRGSIAIDGISLTVTAVDDDGFEVHIIPHTWQHTSLRERTRDDTVNLETDVLGKYVARSLSKREERRPLSIEDLVRAGFV